MNDLPVMIAAAVNPIPPNDDATNRPVRNKPTPVLILICNNSEISGYYDPYWLNY